MSSGEWSTSSSCSIDSCVEVQVVIDGVQVRDTTGRVVTFSHDEWRAFLLGVKAGEFDR